MRFASVNFYQMLQDHSIVYPRVHNQSYQLVLDGKNLYKPFERNYFLLFLSVVVFVIR